MFSLSIGDLGLILGGAVAIGYGAVKYGVGQSLKAFEEIRLVDRKNTDEKAQALATSVKEQHRIIADNVQTLSEKVDGLQSTMDRTLGVFEGLDVDNRLNRHDERIGVLERSNTGDGPYRARQKHSR